MSDVLIVTDDKHLGSVLQGKFEQIYGIQAVIRTSGTEAISMIQILPFDLIICKEKIGSEFTAFKICEYLTTNKADFDKEVEVIILGKNLSGYPKGRAVPLNLPAEKIFAYGGFLMGKEKEMPSLEAPSVPIMTANGSAGSEATTVFVLPKNGLSAESGKQAVKKVPSDYYPFHVRYLVHLPENVVVDFSIFTRLKKGEEFEYNLKVAAGNKLSKAEIDKFLMRTSKDLYVKKDEAKKASEFLNHYFMEKFKRTDMDANERLLINSDGFEILLESFKTATFDKFSVEIIKELVKSLDGLMKLDNVFQHYKNFIVANKMSYGYTHMHFVCMLIFLIIDKFEWAKEQSKNKIIYLALFHDLCLGSDRMIKLHHHYFQEQKNIHEEEKQIMLGHADAAANILESIVKAPKELTSLVREHHGIKSGKGFSDSRSVAVTSLTMAFIVAEDVVTHYLDLFDKLDKTKQREPSRDQMVAFFTELKKKYDKLTYAEVAVAYEKLFLGA